jgi:NADH-quinone oxidoreductase subunit G
LREKMYEFAPALAATGVCQKATWSAFGDKGDVHNVPFAPVIENFYMTDPISRASPTMAKCTEEILPLKAKEAMEKS